MFIQQSLRKGNLLKKFVIGAHPIIQYFIEKLKISETIAEYVSNDKRRKVDTENILCILIHNILTNPSPLYEIRDWLNPLDSEKLGITQNESEFVHDERVARALEHFYFGRHKDIFFRLALRAIKIFNLDCSKIHQDTTSITFSGKYSGWNAREQITYGHNKDFRPDLKQLILGLSITADGNVPLVHKIYDGNQSDDSLHISNHKQLQKLLGRIDFIYTADCKLATEFNLNKIAGWGGLFVSVMPRTWREDAQFRRKIENDEIKWKLILSRKNNRKPKSKTDLYYSANGTFHSLQGYRLYWIRSTQKAEMDAGTRANHIDKSITALKILQTKLNKYNLKTQEQIEMRINKILNENFCNDLIKYEIKICKEYKNKYEKPGRPKIAGSIKHVWMNVYSIYFFLNKTEIEKKAKTDGVFPLITNLNSEKYDAKKVLSIYKFQPFLEKRHSQIKTYQEIAPVYLKKGERVVAYLHIHIMALMVSTLIERKLRLKMHENNIETLPIYPENRGCDAPTMYDIVRFFRNIERYEVIQNDKITVFPARLNIVQKQILKLLEIPLSTYQ